MANSYEVRAEKFIHQIFPYIHRCHIVRDYRESIALFNSRYHRKVRVAHGLTRVVLITSDYVVKTNCGISKHIDRFGGCESEFSVYQKAVADGFEHLLAKPTRVVYKGIEFCVMPRIGGIGKYDDDVEWYLNPEDADWVSEHLFDIHNQNYGWKNGYPVIIDYAADCSQLD